MGANKHIISEKKGQSLHKNAMLIRSHCCLPTLTVLLLEETIYSRGSPPASFFEQRGMIFNVNYV